MTDLKEEVKRALFEGANPKGFTGDVAVAYQELEAEKAEKAKPAEKPKAPTMPAKPVAKVAVAPPKATKEKKLRRK